MTTDLEPALQETMAAVTKLEANLGTMVVALDQNKRRSTSPDWAA